MARDSKDHAQRKIVRGAWQMGIGFRLVRPIVMGVPPSHTERSPLELSYDLGIRETIKQLRELSQIVGRIFEVENLTYPNGAHGS